jgi:hypothetical protein
MSSMRLYRTPMKQAILNGVAAWRGGSPTDDVSGGARPHSVTGWLRDKADGFANVRKIQLSRLLRTSSRFNSLSISCRPPV